jgi:hypothetical protein
MGTRDYINKQKGEIMREQYIPTGKQYATNSESMRAQARLFRNLGDNVTANKWDMQAQQEENYERGNQ